MKNDLKFRIPARSSQERMISTVHQVKCLERTLQEKLSNLQDCVGELEDLLKLLEKEMECVAHKEQQMLDKIAVMQSMNEEPENARLSSRSELSQAQAQLGNSNEIMTERLCNNISESGIKCLFAFQQFT